MAGMTAPTEAGEIGRSALLGLDTRWVNTGAAILVSITMLQATSSIDLVKVPLVSACAVIAVVTVTLIVVQKAPEPYPVRTARAAAAVLTAASVAVTWNYATTDPGFAAWQLQASGTATLILAIRGRILWAWLATAGVNAPTFVWAYAHDLPALLPWTMTLPPVMLVAGATLYNRAIRGAIANVHALESRRRTLEAERESARLTADIRIAAHRRVSRLALPVLAQARNEDASASLAMEAALVEGTLRDAVHAPVLASGPVADAVAAARARGTTVAVRDDSGEPPTEARVQALADRLVPLLAEMDSGRVSIRLAPPTSKAHLTVRTTAPERVLSFRWVDGRVVPTDG